MDEGAIGSDDGTFEVLFQCGPSKETVTLSVPTKSTVEQRSLRAHRSISEGNSARYRFSTNS
jgi:hypothetical protein